MDLQHLIIATTISLFASTSCFASIYNIQDDWSTVSNPNGVWSLGWEQALGSSFNTFNAKLIGPGSQGCEVWYDNTTYYTLGNTSHAWKNTTLSTGYGISPDEISLHPGQNGQFCVLRWTALDAGAITIDGVFGAGDIGKISYFVLLNSDLNNKLVEQHRSSGEYAFNLTTNVQKGSTIDFIVGESYYYGSTPVYANITTHGTQSVPEPSTILLLSVGIAGLGLVRKKVK